MWQRFPQGKDTPVYPAVQQALVDGDPRTLEFHYSPTDRWYETRIYPSCNGVSVFFRDVSDRKRADEELRAALGDAQTANRAKGTFLDLMTHELRTPLQAVLGYSEFLLIAPKGSLTVEQRGDIGYIHQAGDRMLALVNQLLDLSRLEAGGIELAIGPIDLIEVIEAVRQDIAPQAGAKGLTVQIDVPEALPPLAGDGERVRQILLNLAGNAVKFTQTGGIRIAATATVSGGVEIAVSDTGMGITADAMLHIFEAFRQVDSTLSRRHEGSGLGLAIAWKLAQQMGGSISVSSEPSVGSTFTLLLPGQS
jgi:signal transduction histidine kinase